MSPDPSAPLDDAPGRPRDPSDAARLVIGDTAPPAENGHGDRFAGRRWLPWLVMGVTVAGMAAWAAAEALSAEPVPTVSLRPHRHPQARMPADYSFWTPYVVRSQGLEPDAAAEVAYLMRHGRLAPCEAVKPGGRR